MLTDTYTYTANQRTTLLYGGSRRHSSDWWLYHVGSFGTSYSFGVSSEIRTPFPRSQKVL